MPLAISSQSIQDKNALTSDAAWHILLEITIPGVVTPVCVTSNNEDVVWPNGGVTWSAVPFEIEEINEDSKEEVPRVEVRIGNVDRIISAYIRDYDAYIKQNGYSPVIVKIYVVNSKNLSNATPEVEHWFELKQPKSNARWATFVLGASSPYNKRYPMNRILKNHCRFIFADATTCRYGGAETWCDKTLTRCKSLGNSARYGGFPGVGSGGFRFA